MKIVIDIPDGYIADGYFLNNIQNGSIACGQILKAVKNGTPYEEIPQGEWIKGREISRTMIGNKVEHIDYKDYTCSNCGLVLDNLLYWYDGSPFYKFCPNCGADMRFKNELGGKQ